MKTKQAPDVSPKAGPTRRWNISVTKEIDKQVIKYWHSRQLANKSEAIRALVELGLAEFRKEQ